MVVRRELGEGKKYSKGLSESPSVGLSVGGEGEGGREGGVDDAVSCKKAPSSVGRPATFVILR